MVWVNILEFVGMLFIYLKVSSKKVRQVTPLSTPHEATFPIELVVDDRISSLSGRHFSSSKVPQPGVVDKKPSNACRACLAKGKHTKAVT